MEVVVLVPLDDRERGRLGQEIDLWLKDQGITWLNARNRVRDGGQLKTVWIEYPKYGEPLPWVERYYFSSDLRDKAMLFKLMWGGV